MGGLVDLRFIRQRWERDPLRVRIWLGPKDNFEKVDLILKRLFMAQSQKNSIYNNM